jgi:hypothetical protein
MENKIFEITSSNSASGTKNIKTQLPKRWLIKKLKAETEYVYVAKVCCEKMRWPQNFKDVVLLSKCVLENHLRRECRPLYTFILMALEAEIVRSTTPDPSIADLGQEAKCKFYRGGPGASSHVQDYVFVNPQNAPAPPKDHD